MTAPNSTDDIEKMNHPPTDDIPEGIKNLRKYLGLPERDEPTDDAMTVIYWNQYHPTRPNLQYRTKRLPNNLFGMFVVFWLWILNDRIELISDERIHQA